jgi:hypothetical protein
MNPATLANVIQNNNDLRIFCDGCGRCHDLGVHTLAKTLGPEMAVPEIGRRARCTEYGHWGGSMQVVVARC